MFFLVHWCDLRRRSHLVPGHCVQTCARARFSARVQGLHLVPVPEHRAQLLARALTKRCVHIGTRQAPCPGTVPGHQV